MGDKIENFLEQLEFSAKLIGGGSFAIGTLFFAMQLIQPEVKLVGFGIEFIGYAFLINIIFFIALIVCSALYRLHQKALLQTAGMLLLNIPVALIYLFILLSFNSF